MSCRHSPAIGVLLSCALSFLIVGARCASQDYKGYSVLRASPQTSGQLSKLHALSTASQGTMTQTSNLTAHGAASPLTARGVAQSGLEFWTEPVGLNRTVDIMVEPDYRVELEARLNQWEIPHEEMISNLADLITRSSPPLGQANRNALFNGTLRKELLAADQYYRQYHNYAEKEAKLRQLASMDPRIKLEVIGKSSENRSIYLVRVSSDPAANKPVILIDAGHHAREWISHATVMYLLESLVNVDIPRMSARDCDWSTRCREATARRTKLDLDKFDFWFIPVVNPDGYEHTHLHDRLWRKTRSRTACGRAEGVDPNRNYPFHWMEAGASRNPCSVIYAGPSAQSEPEVRAVMSVMDAHRGRIAMYLSFHSYSQYILAPYGYGRVYPDNYQDLQEVADAWIASSGELRNTRYQFGTSAILLYPAAGGSDDYAHGAAGIRFAYTIELPDRGRSGFVLPASEIVPVGQETVMGVKAMIDSMQRLIHSRP